MISCRVRCRVCDRTWLRFTRYSRMSFSSFPTTASVAVWWTSPSTSTTTSSASRWVRDTATRVTNNPNPNPTAVSGELWVHYSCRTSGCPLRSSDVNTLTTRPICVCYSVHYFALFTICSRLCQETTDISARSYILVCLSVCVHETERTHLSLRTLSTPNSDQPSVLKVVSDVRVVFPSAAVSWQLSVWHVWRHTVGSNPLTILSYQTSAPECLGRVFIWSSTRLSSLARPVNSAVVPRAPSCLSCRYERRSSCLLLPIMVVDRDDSDA